MALTLVSGKMLANASVTAEKLSAGAVVAPAGALASNSVFVVHSAFPSESQVYRQQPFSP